MTCENNIMWNLIIPKTNINDYIDLDIFIFSFHILMGTATLILPEENNKVIDKSVYGLIDRYTTNGKNYISSLEIVKTPENYIDRIVISES